MSDQIPFSKPTDAETDRVRLAIERKKQQENERDATRALQRDRQP